MARSAAGDVSPVQEATLRLDVPASDLERARGEVRNTSFELALRPADQRLAIGFVDPAATLASFVSRDITVRGPDVEPR